MCEWKACNLVTGENSSLPTLLLWNQWLSPEPSFLAEMENLFHVNRTVYQLDFSCGVVLCCFLVVFCFCKCISWLHICQLDCLEFRWQSYRNYLKTLTWNVFHLDPLLLATNYWISRLAYTCFWSWQSGGHTWPIVINQPLSLARIPWHS